MVNNLDARLMEIVVCPAPDHGSLRPEQSADSDERMLTCESCGRSFPVRNGIPVLLLDEALTGGHGQANEPMFTESRSHRV